jgi:beta-mannanase
MGVTMWEYDNLAVLDNFTKSVGGNTPAIWSVWSDWRGHNSAFPDAAFLNELLARRTVPMIFWQPVDENDRNGTDFTYAHIVAGDLDAYITSWARAAKDWGHRVIVRFAHEMDGSWFPWGMGNNGNTPSNFVAAWRHIWKIFKGPHGVGASNVRFLWSPLGPCACKPDLYPGDAYVDYVGFTYFNWAGPWPWKTMLDGFKKRVVSLSKLTKKPVIVAETGTNPIGGSKTGWIRNGYRAVYRNLPSVKAIVYFNIDMRTIANQPDWSLESTPTALAAYATLLSQLEYQGRIK